MARLKKHPGRKRRMAGWFVLAWAVVFAGLWVASRWFLFDVLWKGTRIDSASGIIYILRLSGEFSPPFFARAVSNPYTVKWAWWTWKWEFRPSSHQLYYMEIPGWLPVCALALYGLPLLRSGILARRRARVGLCPKCRYDLRGLPPGSPCPECGKANADAMASSAGPAEGTRGS